MNHYFLIIIRYTNGRISIRDRPYKTQASARQARSRLAKKYIQKSPVKAIEIYPLATNTNISDIDVKRYV